MSDNIIFNPDKLLIVDFKLIKGQIEVPERFLSKEIKGFHLENSLELGFNLEDNLIKSDFFVEIKTESTKINDVEANSSFHLIFIFSFEDLQNFTKLGKDNLIELDEVLGNALSSVTYSTSRGILLTKFQGTVFQNFILPIINPNKLLQK